MGLFDDFSDIVGEIKNLKDEVVGEFTGLKDDVKSSVGDIKAGVTDTVDGVKHKAKKGLSIDVTTSTNDASTDDDTSQ